MEDVPKGEDKNIFDQDSKNNSLLVDKDPTNIDGIIVSIIEQTAVDVKEDEVMNIKFFHK